MARGRRYKKRTRAPGKSFWLRPPAFTVDITDTGNGICASTILAPGDFESPSVALNDTQKGAPILERLVIDCGLNLYVGKGYFDPAVFAQVGMMVEAMIWTQPDQYVPLVTTTTSFDEVLENQRILGYEVMKWDVIPGVTYGSGGADDPKLIIKCRSHFEPKSRVKLREQSLCVAFRTNMNLGHGEVGASFPWVQPTMLVRQP